MTDLERLETLLRAGHPCVLLSTTEEERALHLVREAALALDLPVREWSVIRGIRDGLLSGGAAEKDTENPAAALYRFAQATDPAIYLMVDVIDHLGDPRVVRALRELVLRLDDRAGPGGTLVLIDYRDELPPALRALAAPVELTLPDEAEIDRIVVGTLRDAHRDRPIELSITRKQMQAVVRNLRGLSRRQVRRLILEAATDDRRFSAEDLEQITARKREMLASDGPLEFVRAPASLDEIGGLGRLKRWLRERENALEPEAGEFGLSAPRGLLMLGVQGAGKSLCAKAIATAWRRPLLRLDPGRLYDRFVGESERRLRDALHQAEAMAPIVLWIDEIEKGFASAASQSVDGGLSQRMFGTLLTWMQEHTAPVFLAATANDIAALPPELLRKGRFDEVFFVDLPGEEARRAILEIHLAKRRRDPKRFDLAPLVGASEGYSGAEIEQAVVSGLHAAYAARAELTTERILEALRASPPISVTLGERIAELREWARDRCVPAE